MRRHLLLLTLLLAATPAHADTLLKAQRTLTGLDILRLEGDRLHYRLPGGSELAVDIRDVDVLAIDAAPTFASATNLLDRKPAEAAALLSTLLRNPPPGEPWAAPLIHRSLVSALDQAQRPEEAARAHAALALNYDNPALLDRPPRRSLATASLAQRDAAAQALRAAADAPPISEAVREHLRTLADGLTHRNGNGNGNDVTAEADRLDPPDPPARTGAAPTGLPLPRSLSRRPHPATTALVRGDATRALELVDAALAAPTTGRDPGSGVDASAQALHLVRGLALLHQADADPGSDAQAASLDAGLAFARARVLSGGPGAVHTAATLGLVDLARALGHDQPAERLLDQARAWLRHADNEPALTRRLTLLEQNRP